MTEPTTLRHAAIYDAALIAEHEATGAGTPGFARRSALRAMDALAAAPTGNADAGAIYGVPEINEGWQPKSDAVAERAEKRAGWSDAESGSITSGMKPWAGGEDSPDDWDGGPVQYADGAISADKPEGIHWDHANKHCSPQNRIIAYTPKTAIMTGPTVSLRAALEFIAPSLPVLATMCDAAGLTGGAAKAREMADAVEKALHPINPAYSSASPRTDRLGRPLADLAQPAPPTEATTWNSATDDQRERVTLLAEVELHLQSSRVFITSREKMHPCGVDLHDELLAKVTTAIEAIGREKSRG